MKLEQKLRVLAESEKQRIIEHLCKLLCKDDRVVFAYLHGSILEDGPIRDVDIAVWLRDGTDSLEYVLDAGLKLEMVLGLPIDIQVLNNSSIVFRYMVYTRGLPLCVKDWLLHDMETARTQLMYSDLQLLRRIAEGKPLSRHDKRC